jgi:hypothetical protein
VVGCSGVGHGSIGQRRRSQGHYGCKYVGSSASDSLGEHVGSSAGNSLGEHVGSSAGDTLEEYFGPGARHTLELTSGNSR